MHRPLAGDFRSLEIEGYVSLCELTSAAVSSRTGISRTRGCDGSSRCNGAHRKRFLATGSSAACTRVVTPSRTRLRTRALSRRHEAWRRQTSLPWPRSSSLVDAWPRSSSPGRARAGGARVAWVRRRSCLGLRARHLLVRIGTSTRSREVFDLTTFGVHRSRRAPDSDSNRRNHGYRAIHHRYIGHRRRWRVSRNSLASRTRSAADDRRPVPPATHPPPARRDRELPCSGRS
jgi:hypothetical protein